MVAPGDDEMKYRLMDAQIRHVKCAPSRFRWLLNPDLVSGAIRCRNAKHNAKENHLDLCSRLGPYVPKARF